MHKYTMFAADCGKVIRSKLWLKFSEKVIKVSTLAPSFGEVDTNVNIWRLVGKITCQAVPTFKNQNDNVGRPIGHVTCLKPRLKFSLTVNLGRPLGSVTLSKLWLKQTPKHQDVKTGWQSFGGSKLCLTWNLKTKRQCLQIAWSRSVTCSKL